MRLLSWLYSPRVSAPRQPGGHSAIADAPVTRRTPLSRSVRVRPLVRILLNRCQSNLTGRALKLTAPRDAPRHT